MKKFFSKKVLWMVVLGVWFLLPLVVVGAGVDLTIEPNTINPNIPGLTPASQAHPNPVGILSNVFQFALLIGGLLAFVMIVWGGIEYASSGDSGSGMKEAKDRIQQALLGLLLLAGAFVLLQTINPQLTKLEFPTLKSIKGGQDVLPILENMGKENGVCNPSTASASNTGCNEGLRCSGEGRCYKPTDCTIENSSSECPYLSGQICKQGKCVQELKSCAEGCTNTQSCVGGFCKAKGTLGAECVNSGCGVNTGLTCSQRTNICIIPGTCIRSGDCPDPGTQGCSVEGKCVTQSEGSSCSGPGTCPNNLACLSDNKCGNCTSQADCGGSLVCGLSGQCLSMLNEVSCRRVDVDDQKCSAPYRCGGDFCELPCKTDASCPKASDGTQLTCKPSTQNNADPNYRFCRR